MSPVLSKADQMQNETAQNVTAYANLIIRQLSLFPDAFSILFSCPLALFTQSDMEDSMLKRSAHFILDFEDA